MKYLLLLLLFASCVKKDCYICTVTHYPGQAQEAYEVCNVSESEISAHEVTKTDSSGLTITAKTTCKKQVAY